MAKILKEGKTFRDKYNNVYTEAYGAIDLCNGDKLEKQQYFVFNVWKDKRTRDARKEGEKFFAIASYQFDVSKEDFVIYFSPEAITADDNQYARAYDYLNRHAAEQHPEVNWDDWQDH